MATRGAARATREIMILILKVQLINKSQSIIVEVVDLYFLRIETKLKAQRNGTTLEIGIRKNSSF